MPDAIDRAWLRKGQNTLRISIQENDTAIGFTLEGRLAGPWVDELSRAWRETAPRLNQREVRLDLREVTYSDASGKQVLREIFQVTRADLVTRSPWSEYLANEIRNGKSMNGTLGA